MLSQFLVMGLHLQHDSQYRGGNDFERTVGRFQYLPVPETAETVDRLAWNDRTLDHFGHESGAARLSSVAWAD